MLTVTQVKRRHPGTLPINVISFIGKINEEHHCCLESYCSVKVNVYLEITIEREK